jgi:hypothetical protein
MAYLIHSELDLTKPKIGCFFQVFSIIITSKQYYYYCGDYNAAVVRCQTYQQDIIIPTSSTMQIVHFLRILPIRSSHSQRMFA